MSSTILSGGLDAYIFDRPLLQVGHEAHHAHSCAPLTACSLRTSRPRLPALLQYWLSVHNEACRLRLIDQAGIE